MKLRNSHMWIAVFSTVAVLAIAVVDIGRTSPGALSSVHERVEELRGSGGCANCHGSWGQSMTDACIECHLDIETQIELGDGLHGLLSNAEAGRCGSCHSDHHGPGAPIVNARSFARAGVDDPENFDHGMIGFAMRGKHLETDCADCHTNAHTALLPEGEKRFLGLEQDCEACHDSAHEPVSHLAELRAPDCASCHGQDTFEESEANGHESHLPLVGGHADLACADCHELETPRSLESLANGEQRLKQRACLDCHESPHAETFIDEIANLSASKADATCVVCHESEHLSFRDEAVEVSAAQHARSGFTLNIPHDEVTCAECHAPELETFAERFPGRDADTCVQCHDDPHGGQFDEGPFAEPGCIACHSRQHFDPHEFDQDKHALAALPIEGTHFDIECSACHADPDEDQPRQFRGTPAQCVRCHDDAHSGVFDAYFDAEVEASVDCARCHLATTFDDIVADSFQHAEWTPFDVQGAHAQGSCETCHVPAAVEDQFGRTFGRIEDEFGTYEGCVTCHVDPHRGSFDSGVVKGAPDSIEGREGCARCHEQSSFRSIDTGPDGFDHGLWTGFALEHAHGELDCSACHASLPRPDVLGRTWGEAAGSSCSACHADPHAGQFKESGETDCARCHDSSRSFAETAFIHDLQSDFALGDAHRGLACNACHSSWDVSDELSIVRYKPLDSSCSACHAEHHETLRGRDGRTRGQR